jgi:hypothetical protein
MSLGDARATTVPSVQPDAARARDAAAREPGGGIWLWSAE